jgi:imidazole glycerol-phosphate synthase subunit HisH
LNARAVADPAAAAATVDVALVDAGGANLGSVRYALERLGVRPRLVRDGDGLDGATHVVLPGVGAAAPAMAALRARGLDAALRASTVPLLGICLGMQLLFDHSEEGGVDCLGLLPGVVARMRPAPGIRVPHMGWNRLQPVRPSRLLAGIDGDAWAYFVHGYAAPVGDACVAAGVHGQRFAAVVETGRIGGAQFHPERSAAAGAALLRNFIGVAA